MTHIHKFIKFRYDESDFFYNVWFNNHTHIKTALGAKGKTSLVTVFLFKYIGRVSFSLYKQRDIFC